MSLSKDDLADISTLIVEGTTEAFNAVVNPRFDRIEQRLDVHDEQFKKLDKRLEKIEQHLVEHDHRFDQIDRQLNSIEARLTKLEGSVEALENDVKALYSMVPGSTDTGHGKATPEQRLREMFASMQALARELDIEL